MRGKHSCQQPIHIPCCPEKSNGSHSNILERLIQNVLSVQWGEKAGSKVQTFASGAAKEQRDGAKDQPASQHLILRDERENLSFGSRCWSHQEKNKQTPSHKGQTGATCQNQDHVRLLDKRPTGWRLKRKKSWAGRKKHPSASVTQKIPLKFLSILLVCLFAVGSRLCPQGWEEKFRSHREVSIQY